MKMFDMFPETNIISYLKTIVKTMEEHDEYALMLQTFINETNKGIAKCDCEKGIKRLKCPKCKGTDYYLVEKVED